MEMALHGPELADFISQHRLEILERWASARRLNEKAAKLTHQDLLDHLPHMLDVIAKAIAEGRPDIEEATGEQAAKHAIHRLDVGFELDEIVEEYAILRRVLFQVLREHRPELIVGGFEVLETAIDRSVGRSVTRFAEIRHRTLRALDQVSEIALGAEDLEALLPRLLEVLVQTTPAVDSAVILLSEGDRLRVRAAVGLIAERDNQFSVQVGEGFAGTIAATARPLFLRSAATDPLVKSDFIRQRGVRALYGVPLMRGHEVIGVAHMGSVTAYEFGEEDRLLFRTTAERAAMLIVQAEQRGALKQASEFRDQVIAIASHDLRNPLQAITLSSHMLLRREGLPEGILRTIQRIDTSAARIEAILSGLLDYTQTRFKGRLLLKPEETHLAEVGRQTLDELQVAHAERSLHLEVQGDVRGRWDPRRVAQVISNLVTNALQHGDPTAPVEVALQGEDEAVTLSVRNQGKPIPADLMPHLFEPFRRGAGASEGESQPQGFGLGLYIVQQIALAHGGTVGVRSDPSGTVFTVRLPRQV